MGDHEQQSEEDMLANYPLSHGLTASEAAERLAKYGPNCLPDKKKSKILLFCENLWQPMPIILWIAAIVEFAIQNWADGAILIAINLLNASLSFYEANKAGNAVEALKNSLKPTAIVKRDGVWDHRSGAYENLGFSSNTSALKHSSVCTLCTIERSLCPIPHPPSPTLPPDRW